MGLFCYLLDFLRDFCWETAAVSGLAILELVVELGSWERKDIKREPRKLPRMARTSDQEKATPTPRVMTFAMQCWKPQKMKSGMPKMMPSGVPFLYILTARYMMTPQRNDLTKKAIEKSQEAIFSRAGSARDGSAKRKRSPNR